MKNKTDEGKRMEGNLTKGPILKTLTKLAIPIMASSFLGTLYNITDMAWIGLLGSKAVAGVGVGGMFTWLSQGLAAMARWHSALDAANVTEPMVLHRQQCSLRHLWEWHTRLFRLCLHGRWSHFFS